MIQSLQTLSRQLAQHASLFVTAVAVLTFFVPDLFVWVRGTTQTVILGIIMLTMGLTLTTQDFRILVRRPGDILIGACAQFLVMPCVAWLLVRIFHLEPALALGILLVGCCPGGVSSNIMSYLCHGDVAFSVGMTCTSTLLAPVMTPVLMELTAGEIIEIDAVGMFLNILKIAADENKNFLVWTLSNIHKNRDNGIINPCVPIIQQFSAFCHTSIFLYFSDWNSQELVSE